MTDEKKTQQDEIIQRLSKENSAMHKELIALRRKVERLERTLGKMDKAIELACTPMIIPWHEGDPIAR